MKPKLFIKIALRVIILFIVGMLMTYVPDHLRPFFGDTPFVPTDCYQHNSAFNIDNDWVWGIRHYWYFWMMFVLFVLALINTIVSIRKDVLAEYPDI